MSNDNEDQIPSTFLEVLNNTLDGGVLRIVASKPVQQAIGRLVAGVTDIPVAYLESISRDIRRETEAKDKVHAAIVAAAASKASADEALVLRGVERWTRQLGAKQKSRETVAIKTLEVLAENEDLKGASAPSEDFMRMFEDIVEKVSSEQLADLMARILAGEIRKAGSVSRRTLQTVAILDQEIVRAFLQLQPYMLDGFWWVVPSNKRDEWRSLFWLLSNAAITDTVQPRRLTPDESGRTTLRMGSQAILVCDVCQKFGAFIDGASLTPTGIELFSVLPISANRKLDEIANGLKESGHLAKIEIVQL